MIYYSTENLKTETLDKETRDRILSLSYEKFFRDSVNTENEISFLIKSVEDVNKDYVTTAKILKEKIHTMSFEDGETTDKVKTNFFANISNWFIRIWAIIVTVFEKIVAVIQSLIKSLILYVKKHLLLKNSLYTRIGKDRNLSVSFNAPNKETNNRVLKVLNDKYTISTLDINGTTLLNFEDLYYKLTKNDKLNNFVKAKIIVNNKKSTINLDNLNLLFQKLTIIKDAKAEVGPEFTSEERMNSFSDAITELTSQAVLYGEADGSSRIESVYGEKDEINDSILNCLKTGNIKGAANLIVYNSTDIKRESIHLNEFLGLSTEQYTEANISEAFSILRKCMGKYEVISHLIIDKGGFCDIITEILKRYSSAANNDKKIIKDIKDKIIKFMQTIDKSDEQGQKLAHKCKRFTNLIIRVQKIKNDFVLLRQHVLGNVLTAYSTMDKALSMVLIPFDPSKIKEKENELKDIVPEYVGGKSGINPDKIATIDNNIEEGF